MSTIDLNSDIGESFGAWTMGDDEAILDVVTSANIACGFHAGDPSHMRRTVRAAAACGVRIGAHVSYRDLAGFGRRFVDASPDELADDVIYQIGALQGMARAEGARVAYVKPHGALYNTIVHHEQHARAVVEAVRAVGGAADDSGAADGAAGADGPAGPDGAGGSGALALLLLPGSRAAELAREAGLAVIGEAFADRAYTPSGTLVPRRESGAVIEDPVRVAERMVRFATSGEIEATDGTVLRPEATSICLHGDTPGAVDLARAVRRGLEDAGVDVRSFA
ncbi:LamB/YcsF family protein [Brachybacterium sp. ACRRE]|uniref:LamB/YcsF family protein n=1 Tax=Brachybacterium sp. ACRRE TaxID=2918184 RepID=UPI001EF2E89A|nr:5-oxoprolinase subunit PxpA [Brachybacterium sp. ACRRE]MCG7308945.1 LamB/YcsF family protein [Brachybacterium sp. ACRRE]